MTGLDSLSDIDLFSIPESVWEIDLETESEAKTISLLNIPSGITSLELGVLLSKSLSEPFHLPISLVSYRGPFLSGMVFPPNIERIHIIETQKSMNTRNIDFPENTKTLIVENPLRFSNLDMINLPNSLLTFKIVGSYNCSFEKLRVNPGLLELDLGESKQPTDLLNVGNVPNFTHVQDVLDVEYFEKSPLVVTSRNRSVLDSLYQNKPRVDKIHVVLDDVLKTIGDVWEHVLFEGRVSVRELTLINGTNNSCLSDCEDVFMRSEHLDRKLCRNLIILCETFKYTNHLGLARSLRNLGDITVEISYMKKSKPTPCIVPRLASILGIEYSDSKYSSNKFGIISTTVGMGADGNLKFVMGSSPMKYSTPTLKSNTVPISSTSLVDSSLDTKPKPKSIILHTWSKCGFCDKQEAFIKEFKDSSENHKNTFNDMVLIKKLENPEDVDDKRVDSFPTWVKDGNLIVGVQNHKKLEEMLNLNTQEFVKRFL